jgi:hypothetical protein
MASPKINTGFSGYSDPALETKAQLITTAMIANPTDFPAPHPELDAAVAATTAYVAALLQARNGNKTDVVVKNQKKAELVSSLKQLGEYVMFKAKGNAGIMTASNFDMSKEPEPAPGVTNPEITLLVNGVNAGELQVAINKVPGARSYIYQYSLSDPTLAGAEWVSHMSTVGKFTFKNLESGKRYWCRVAAVGAREQVAYGDPLSRIVI